MYPPRFDYLAPTSVEEVVAALGEREGAKVMAGGQSLIPVMKLRFASARHGRRHQPRRRARRDRGGRTASCASARSSVTRTCERSPLLHEAATALLGATARLVSDPLVRNRGTVCGSLAHADPQGDWGSALLAARAQRRRARSAGRAEIAVDELALGPFTTTLEPDEVITEVRVPDPGPRARRRLPEARAQGRRLRDRRRRRPGRRSTNGHVGQAGIGLTGVGATNLRATAAEDAPARQRADATTSSGRRRRSPPQAAEPQSDNRGSAEYKRNVVRVFCERGLRTAISAAQAGEE